MLAVRDIMQRDVLTVLPDVTVRALSRLLADKGISGVPVVNQAGHVLGVVSSTDVVRLAAEEAEVPLGGAHWLRPPATSWEGAGEGDSLEEDERDVLASYFLPEDNPLVEPEWEARLGDDAFGEIKVEDIMTPVSFSIQPDATVRELADFLVRGRIHRAIVSEGNRLVGIVTTMDVLRALAGSAW